MAARFVNAVRQWVFAKWFTSGARRRFLLDTVTLGAGTVLGQTAVVLSLPIITRLYSSADMGRLGLFLAVLAPGIVASSLRFDLAIASGRDADDRDRLLLLSLAIVPVVALVASVLVGLLIGTDSLGLGTLGTSSVAGFCVVLALSGVFTSLRYWHVGESNFRPISNALFGQGLGRATGPIALAPITTGWGGLVIGEIIGRMVGACTLLIPAWTRLIRALREAHLADLRECAKRFRNFPIAFLPSGLLDSIAAAAPIALIGKSFGMADLGQFVLAQRVVAVPATLLGAVLGDVYHSRFVEAARESARKPRTMLSRGAVFLLALGIAAATPLALLSVWGFRLIVGDGWEEAAVFVGVLTPTVVSGLVTNPLSRAMLVSAVPEMKLIADTARLLFPTLAVLIATAHDVSHRGVVIWYSMAVISGDLIYYAIIRASIAPQRILPSLIRPPSDRNA